jgi:Flp pilus assembly pilin Flp
MDWWGRAWQWLAERRYGVARDQRGQGMAEYIIIVILVAIVVIAVVLIFGETIMNLFNSATEQLEAINP